MKNPLSNEARQIVLGTLLGDGHLELGTGNRHYKLVMCHSTKNSAYANWKYSFFKDICIKPSIVTAWHKRNKKYYSHILIRTSPMSYFTRLRRLFYLDGKKIVRRTILNHLTPQAIAVWFMDDGTTTKNNKGYPQLFLYTCSFSIKDNEIIKQYFKDKFGIDCLIHCRDKYPRIYFNKPNAQKLISIIGQYFIPEMRYKLRYFLQTNPVAYNAMEDIV